MVVGLTVKPEDSSWEIARRAFISTAQDLPGKMKIAVSRAAQAARTRMVYKFRSSGDGSWTPISKFTVWTRKTHPGTTKPLIDQGGAGGLMGSITVTAPKKMRGGFEAFAGVLRTARRKKAEIGRYAKFENIAIIQERGIAPFNMYVTRRMFWWMFFLRQRLGDSVWFPPPMGSMIRHPGIPARPFLRPTFEEMKPIFEGIVFDVFRDLLRRFPG